MSNKNGSIRTRNKEDKFTFVSQAKMLRIFQVTKMLLSQRLTVKEMSVKIDTPTRTVYRYMDAIENTGVEIQRTKMKYFVDVSECPVCGKNPFYHMSHISDTGHTQEEPFTIQYYRQEDGGIVARLKGMYQAFGRGKTPMEAKKHLLGELWAKM